MIDNEKDAGLRVPSEANTTKHFNFREAEGEGGDEVKDTSNINEDESNSTKKAWEEMRKDLQKEGDVNLQAPQEANTTKHFNFVAAENGDAPDSSNDVTDNVSDDNNPTKKAWQELKNDQEKG